MLELQPLLFRVATSPCIRNDPTKIISGLIWFPFEHMLQDHNKLLYPTCEDGQKKLGSTLELLKWKAETGVTDSSFKSCWY